MRLGDKINKSISNFYTSQQRLKYAFYVLSLLVVLSGSFLTKISFNFDFESFFPVGHPDREVFLEFKDRFDYDNDFLLITLKNRKGIFKSEFIEKLAKIADEIKSLNNTDEIISPTNIAIPVKTSFGLSKIQVLHPSDENGLVADSIRLVNNGTFEKNLFSIENQSVIIKIRHKHFDDFQTSENYVNDVKRILTEADINDYYLAGRSSVQSEFVELIKTDFGLFIALAFAIIIIFLKVQYGSWPAVFIPLLLILTTIITTLGIMTAFGYSLNILTVLIPTIISFVAISDVIHFYTKFHVSLLNGHTHQEALLKTIKEIGLATFLTSLTTAIGFISLVSIRVVPVQLLGVFTAVGVFIAFGFTFVLLPFFSRHLTQKKEKNTRIWQRISSWCFETSLNRQGIIISLSLVLLIVGVAGASLIKIDAYLLDDLPDNSFSKQSFESIDQNFGGTKPWNLYFYTPDGSPVLQSDYLEELDEIQNYLKSNYGLKNIISPLEELKIIRQSYNGGMAKQYKLPSEQQEINQLLKFNQKLAARKILIIGKPEADYGKISGFIPEWGSLRTAEKDQQLMAFIDKIHSKKLEYKITGTTYLIDRSHEYLSENLFWGLLFAFCSVAVISVVLFRSFAMILITLIPNMLPVLLTAAVIGIWGIPIKLTTSIIFAISFGIAVDDTIHFISKFKIERSNNSTIEAVKNTFSTAGMAIIKTTVLLCLGFGVFCFSSFGASFFTGFFIVLTLIFALLIDLFLLPVLLFKFFPENKENE
ncbi:MAG: MMPL family transporter [Bacteroidota bacterium]